MGARLKASLGSVMFLLVAPGTAAGLLPWLITGWQANGVWLKPALAGRGVLIAAGVAALLHAFARFALEGIGTPAPVAPTEELVVGGLYRHARNPMYLAMAATIVGQALLLGRLILFVYALAFMALVAAFVRFYEEPTLSRRFGERYEEYRRTVPAWRPRLRRSRGRIAPRGSSCIQ